MAGSLDHDDGSAGVPEWEGNDDAEWTDSVDWTPHVRDCDAGEEGSQLSLVNWAEEKSGLRVTATRSDEYSGV